MISCGMLIERFREDDIQALIAIAQLDSPVDNPNDAPHIRRPKSIAEAQTYFRRFSLDLADAFKSLEANGLLANGSERPELTHTGREAANELRILRPPIYYWYRDFYSAIENSIAFDEYARRVFGANFGQHGFSDLSQLQLLLNILGLTRSSRVLDLGCGNGRTAEYISDTAGCSVTGIDYVPEAIEYANGRTRDKRDRLSFQIMNIEFLDFPAHSFDAIVSVDTIFFGRSMDATISSLGRILKVSGTMAVFNGDYSREQFIAALSNNGMRYEIHDLTQEHIHHMLLKHRVAQDMREAFESEGNAFVWENLMQESFAGLESVGKTDFNPKVRYLCIARGESGAADYDTRGQIRIGDGH
jgi:SAM-dependent methyltransferase